MKKPIYINTESNFALIGPILAKDGVLICDMNPPISLIGTAFKIYRDGTNKDNIKQKYDVYERKLSNYKRCSYFWSDPITLGNRKHQLLFIINGEINRSITSNLPKIKSELHRLFNTFLVDASLELSTYISRKSEADKTTYYETVQASIMWLMSEFLTCCELNFVFNNLPPNINPYSV